jgi:hypothetical protein
LATAFRFVDAGPVAVDVLEVEDVLEDVLEDVAVLEEVEVLETVDVGADVGVVVTVVVVVPVPVPPFKYISIWTATSREKNDKQVNIANSTRYIPCTSCRKHK